MARERIPRGAHHFDQAFGDLRHLDAEQLDQHLRRSTRQDQLRAAVLGADFLEQRTNAGANPESLAGNDVFTGQQGLGVVTEVDDDAVTSDLLHRTGNDLADAVAIGLNDLSALGLAHLLHDDLLGSLRRDPAELDGLDLFFEHVTELGVRIAFLSLIERQLVSRVLEVLIVDDRPTTGRFRSCRCGD